MQTKQELVVPIRDKRTNKLLKEIRYNAQPESELKKKIGRYSLERAQKFLEDLGKDVTRAMNALDSSLKETLEEIGKVCIIDIVKKDHNNRKKIHLQMNEKVEVISQDSTSATIRIKRQQ